MALIVIPARYSSSRFPGKPLVEINGLPMVVRVYRQAIKSELGKKVIIATDDLRIFEIAKKFKCNVEMTSEKHRSGTDRVSEIAIKNKFEIVVNLQGDEPFIEPDVIDGAIEVLKKDSGADISTPIKKIENGAEIDDENVVKVVFNEKNFALYFSRAPIPFYRDNTEQSYYKHIGLYAFRKNSLEKFVRLKQSKLEKIEKLEQLRALENNMKIKVFQTSYNSISIDTPEDLEKLMQVHGSRFIVQR